MRVWISMATICALALGVATACGEEGPAEKAGREIDEAMEEMGEAAEEAVDDMKKAAKEATGS